jgi:hypothetical protein
MSEVNPHRTRRDSFPSTLTRRHDVKRWQDTFRRSARRCGQGVSEAILQVTTAVSMQVFDLIKDRLPDTLQARSPSTPPIFRDRGGSRDTAGASVPEPADQDIRSMGGYRDTESHRRHRRAAAPSKEQWEMMGAMVGADSPRWAWHPDLERRQH